MRKDFNKSINKRIEISKIRMNNKINNHLNRTKKLIFVLLIITLISCKSTENNNDTLSDEANLKLPQYYNERIDIDFTETKEISNEQTQTNGENTSSKNINNNTEDNSNEKSLNSIVNKDYITDVIDINRENNNTNLTDNNFLNYNMNGEQTANTQYNTDKLLDFTYQKNNETVKSLKNFYNSIIEYTYVDGKIYNIILSKDFVTDIRLEGGEEISGNLAIGNSAYWSIETVSTIENDENIIHVLIRPEYDESETNVIVPTNRRTYYFHLSTTDKFPMIGVRFRYPKNKNILKSSFIHNKLLTGNQNYTSLTTIDASKLNFDYEIKENDYSWSPETVFSDGKSTYFQFDPTFRDSFGAPALYFKNNDEISLVNYTILGNLYITKTIIDSFSSFLLIKGKENIEITRSIL